MNEKITYLGTTDYRARDTKFGIKDNDRTRHTYIIGKTGMGKSTLIENMIIQDIQNGNGVCFIDPHGSSAETLLKYIPEHRLKDVVYFAPHDIDYPLALNVLEKVEENQRHLVANGLMAAFKKIFGEDKFSDRIQYYLNNIMLALLENDGQTLLGVNRMLSDPVYRKWIVSNVKDPSVKAFWNEEYVRAGESYTKDAAPGIQNKIGQFISNPLIRNIIGQKKTSFDLREIMDQKKILICNFSIGRMGEGNVNLLGNLMITKIYLAAMSRANLGADEMAKAPQFYFYVDEFQNFVNESFAQILSQARKYNLALTVAHQYIKQMTEEVEDSVFGNVGTMILFRVGAEDAERFEKEFSPQFTMDDIVNLSARQIYLRLSIDGVGSKPFSAKTLPPIAREGIDYTARIIANSRESNAKKKSEVEEEVADFYKPLVINKPEPRSSTNQTNQSSSSNQTSQSPRSDQSTHSHQNTSQPYNGERRSLDRRDQRDFTPTQTESRHEQKLEQRSESKPSQRSESRPDHSIRSEFKATPRSDKPNNSLRDALNVALGISTKSIYDVSKPIASTSHYVKTKTQDKVTNEASLEDIQSLLHDTKIEIKNEKDK